MRNRDYKIFRQGQIYHLFNRGNNREVIYHDDTDYAQFLKRFKLVLGQPTSPLPLFNDKRKRTLSIQPLPANSFTIIAYCLMPNHFHILIKQNTEIGVDRLITKLCTSYAAYYNKRYEHVGHVFQDAFKAKLVDSDSYLTYLSAYIHNNPADAANYPYSSFFDYSGLRAGTLCDKTMLLNYFSNSPKAYRDFVLNYNPSYEAKISHLLFNKD
jgi:putative transposase